MDNSVAIVFLRAGLWPFVFGQRWRGIIIFS